MSGVIMVGPDLAKSVFQVHGSEGSGRVVLRKKLQRAQVLAFFSQLRPCIVAMEACGGAHFWGRGIGKRGHGVRLIARLLQASGLATDPSGDPESLLCPRNTANSTRGMTLSNRRGNSTSG